MFYYLAELVQLSRQSVFYQAALNAEPERPQSAASFTRFCGKFDNLGFGLSARS